MPTWERWIAEQEDMEMGKWASSVEMTLMRHLETLAWRPRGCFQVTLSPKDGDLMLCGCYGIAGIRIQEETALVTFGQHHTMQFCETCQVAHKIAEFDEWCDDGVDSQYEDFVEERRDTVIFDLPDAVQQSIDDADTLTFDAYVKLAKSIVDRCESWATEEYHLHRGEDA